MNSAFKSLLLGALCTAYALQMAAPASAGPLSVADRTVIDVSTSAVTSAHYTGYPHHHGDDNDHDSRSDQHGR